MRIQHAEFGTFTVTGAWDPRVVTVTGLWSATVTWSTGRARTVVDATVRVALGVVLVLARLGLVEPFSGLRAWARMAGVGPRQSLGPTSTGD